MLQRVRSHHDFMWSYLKRLFLAFTRPAIIFLSFFTLTVINGAAALFYYFENIENNNITSYFDAFYFISTTITSVGYGDITPITNAGKIIAIFIMYLGTALFVSFTAVIATSIIDIEPEAQA